MCLYSTVSPTTQPKVKVHAIVEKIAGVNRPRGKPEMGNSSLLSLITQTCGKELQNRENLITTRMFISIVTRPFLDDINSNVECNVMECICEILAGGLNYIKSNLPRSKISFNTGVT